MPAKNGTVKWERNDSNPAHVFLKKMFLEDKIAPDEKAANVFSSNPEVFGAFSLPVFRNVFNELRGRHGTERKS